MTSNEQQKFWSVTYEKEYQLKNSDFDFDLGIAGWNQMLNKADAISSFLECGCNIGRNLVFLDKALPDAKKSVVEISKSAFEYVNEKFSLDRSFNGPIIDSAFEDQSFDLVYTTQVLIHIHPDELLDNMEKMFNYSKKYILICEYFNRTPASIEYQGEMDKLFKCDFGKLFIQNFDVELIDYGFHWGHIYDVAGFDDTTWWLFKKNS